MKLFKYHGILIHLKIYLESFTKYSYICIHILVNELVVFNKLYLFEAFFSLLSKHVIILPKTTCLLAF